MPFPWSVALPPNPYEAVIYGKINNLCKDSHTR